MKSLKQGAFSYVTPQWLVKYSYITPSREGWLIVIGKTKVPSAVVRNSYKRKIREILKKLDIESKISGVIIKRKKDSQTFQEIYQDLSPLFSSLYVKKNS